MKSPINLLFILCLLFFALSCVEGDKSDDNDVFYHLAYIDTFEVLSEQGNVIYSYRFHDIDKQYPKSIDNTFEYFIERRGEEYAIVNDCKLYIPVTYLYYYRDDIGNSSIMLHNPEYAEELWEVDCLNMWFNRGKEYTIDFGYYAYSGGRKGRIIMMKDDSIQIVFEEFFGDFPITPSLFAIVPYDLRQDSYPPYFTGNVDTYYHNYSVKGYDYPSNLLPDFVIPVHENPLIKQKFIVRCTYKE